MICENPYRLFFPLGILMGIIGVGHWLIYGAGLAQSYSGLFHSSIQMQAYMASFVIGFLLTALPRFASAPPATGVEIKTFLALILGVWIFLSLRIWFLSELCFILLLLFLIFFAGRRFTERRGTAQPPVEFVWIPIAVIHGILGSLMMIVSQLDWLAPAFFKCGKVMVDQGFIIGIVMGVGSFLSPRLMGLFRPAVQRGILDDNLVIRLRKIQMLWNIFFGTIFFLSFWLESFVHQPAGYLLRAAIITIVFYRSRCWPKLPLNKEMFVLLVWLSLWMMISGYWLAGFFPRYRVEMLHLVFIGGLVLMTFAIGTMVVISHAGQAELLKKNLYILWTVLAGTACALILRLAVIFLPKYYFILLALASGCWLVVGVAWLIFIFPRIIKVSDSEDFERTHEEAKEKIIKLQRKKTQ